MGTRHASDVQRTVRGSEFCGRHYTLVVELEEERQNLAEHVENIVELGEVSV